MHIFFFCTWTYRVKFFDIFEGITVAATAATRAAFTSFVTKDDLFRRHRIREELTRGFSSMNPGRANLRYRLVLRFVVRVINFVHIIAFTLLLFEKMDTLYFDCIVKAISCNEQEDLDKQDELTEAADCAR